MSPERFQGLKQYECSSDIFVFGIIIYYTINMKAPFPSTQGLIELLKKKKYGEKIFLPLEEI